MDGETLNLFPDSPAEALALLYVQNQDLSGKTPAEIQTMYYQAYYELLRDKKAKKESGWFTAQKADG